MTPIWLSLAMGGAALAAIYVATEVSHRRSARADDAIARHEAGPLPRRIPGAPVDGIPLSDDDRAAEIAALSRAWRSDPAPEPTYRSSP